MKRRGAGSYFTIDTLRGLSWIYGGPYNKRREQVTIDFPRTPTSYPTRYTFIETKIYNSSSLAKYI